MPRPAKRTIGTGLAVQSIPDVSYSQGAANALRGLGQSLLYAGRIASAEQKKRDLVLAEQEGARLAHDTALGAPLPEMESTSDYNRAYNAALRKAYLQRVDAATRAKVGDLAARHRFDPEGLQKGLGAWAAGMKQNMPLEMQGLFDSHLATLAQPKILAEVDRRWKANEENRAAAQDAQVQAILADAHDAGRLMGEGGTAAGPAAQSALQSYFDGIAAINSGVGFDYTPGEAQQQTVLYTSGYTRRLVAGIFDGSTNQEKLYGQMLRGDLDVPAPDLVENEKGVLVQQWRKMNVVGMLTDEDRNALRQHMSATITARRSADDHWRGLRDRQANENLRASKRAAAMARTTEQRMAAMRETAQNPMADDKDIETVRRWVVEGVTDPQYARATELDILSPVSSITSVYQLDPARLSSGDRARLDKLIEDRYKTDHWSNSRAYKLAEDHVRLKLGAEIQQTINVVFNGKDRGKLRQQAVNRMILAMRHQIQTRVDRGYQIRTNPGGAMEAEDKGPNGEPLPFFDPQAWAVQTLDRLESIGAADNTRIQELRRELRENKGKIAAGDKDPALLTEQTRLRADIKSLKDSMVERLINAVNEEIE